MRLAWEKIVNPPASMLGTSQTSEILSFFFDSVLKGSRGKARISVDDQKKFVLQGIEIWDYLNDKVNLSIYQFLSTFTVCWILLTYKYYFINWIHSSSDPLHRDLYDVPHAPSLGSRDWRALRELPHCRGSRRPQT